MNAVIRYIVNLKDNFVNLVTSMHPVKDTIDIILVAIIFYYVFRFLKERRAGKLAIGVVLLFALQFFSDLFGFVALRFIMGNVLQIGVIALVILFQPELRSALEKVGGGGTIKNIIGITAERIPENRDAMISDICEAACDMSKDKTGALIVIERGTRLGEIIDSGVVVDADISPFLIKNIFFNKAPLHDGAMVIRNGRIHAAGCFLPLSSNESIVKALGTRHRAAIGMSENSDAVVVVVSEETGNISIALEGKLYANLNRGKLRAMLEEQLPSDGVKKNVIHRFRIRKKEDDQP